MSEEKKPTTCIVAVRVRGTVSASRQVRETLQMLHLTHNNHCVIIDTRPSFLGMLKTSQNFVTWGEPSKETINMLIAKKGRLAGDKRLTDEYAQKAGFKSLEDLAEAVQGGRSEFRKLPDVQPAFRLHPPIKGFKGKIKTNYGVGGELGYRGEKINELVQRMM